MSDKSHVSMETKQCPICGEVWKTGSILLDRRLQDSMEPLTCTGWGLCPEHTRMHEQGYVAMVEATFPEGASHAKITEPERTGRVMFVAKETFARVFDSVPEGPMAFIDPEAFEHVAKRYRQDTGHDVPEINWPAGSAN